MDYETFNKGCLEEAKRLYKTANADQRYVLEKLFPELRETEDEKIRKEIVRFIQMEVEDEIVGNKWLAWLEKQAEQEYQLKEGNFYECIKSYHYIGVVEYWFDEGKVYFCEKDGYLRLDPYHLIKVCDCENWQSYFRPYIGKSVWSEEDEAGLGDALWAIKQARTIAKDENDMGNLWYAENWLKSIKSRISLKQEWSEEEIEKAAQEWESKAIFNPFYMTMDGDKPTGVTQDITTHKESFKAGVEWILKKIGF